MAGRGGVQRPNGGGPQGATKICQFKLVLLGESAVGKSSLVLRFVKGQFQEYQESTIGGRSPAIVQVHPTGRIVAEVAISGMPGEHNLGD